MCLSISIISQWHVSYNVFSRFVNEVVASHNLPWPHLGTDWRAPPSHSHTHTHTHTWTLRMCFKTKHDRFPRSSKQADICQGRTNFKLLEIWNSGSHRWTQSLHMVKSIFNTNFSVLWNASHHRCNKTDAQIYLVSVEYSLVVRAFTLEFISM
jgi:hypothetical protein